MNQQNLGKILNGEVNNLILINANEESFAFMDYIISVLRHNLGQTNSYKFYADRYFKYETIFQLFNNGNLFDEIIYIEINYKNKPTVEHQNEIKKLFTYLNKNVYLIITTDILGKSDFNSFWVKEISETGAIISISENSVPEIIKHSLKQNYLTIKNNAIDMLLELNQGNNSQLMQEVNKLKLFYTDKHDITPEDIKQISLDNALHNIYHLSGAYLNGDLGQCIKILDNIYQKPEDAILLQWLIAEDLKKLIRLKSKLQQSFTFHQVSSELKIWGSNSKFYLEANNRLSYYALINILDELSKLDMIIKGIIDSDVKSQLISILAKFCNKGI